MDTLSALFSKNFKKDPAPPQFHGINEDLYEGKKLISKRRRTKNKIAKKSSLVEGFANELDDVTATEDVQTVQLNTELQKNLSSYATSLKGVLGDYVTARTQQQQCVQRCNDLPAISLAPQCSDEDVTGCTTCESCYAKGPGFWCSDTGRCSTYNNPCTGSCGQGGLQVSPPSIQCPASFPYLRDFNPNQCTADNVEGCTTCESCWAQGPGFWCSDTGRCSTHGNPCTGSCGQGGLQTSPQQANVSAREWFCYQEPDGNSTGEGGLCNCNCPQCGNNNNFTDCTEWGATCINVAQEREEEAESETRERKDSCLAGCKLSEAYLEPTSPIAQANNQTITNCDQLQPECSDANVEGCTTCQDCYSKGPGYWCADTGTCSTLGNPCRGNCSNICTDENVETCTTCESCYARGPGFWCSDTGTCSTYGNPCTGSCGQGGLQTNERINQIIQAGQQNVAACNQAEAANANAIQASLGGRNLTREYSNLKGEYLSSNQCTDQDVTGCSTCEDCYSKGPGYWCADTQTCSTYGNPCTGNCTSQCTADNVEGCTTCPSCWAQGPGFWCSDTGRCSTHGNPCTGSCGQGGYQSTPEQNNVLMKDGNSISSRIASLLGMRQDAKTSNENTRQNLTNTLGAYTSRLDKLKNTQQGSTTIKAMIEEGTLKKGSAFFKYYIWLGLAICVLMVAIRQLKK